MKKWLIFLGFSCLFATTMWVSCDKKEVPPSVQITADVNYTVDVAAGMDASLFACLITYTSAEGPVERYITQFPTVVKVEVNLPFEASFKGHFILKDEAEIAETMTVGHGSYLDYNTSTGKYEMINTQVKYVFKGGEDLNNWLNQEAHFSYSTKITD